ncbi:hypothetical protein HOW07_14285 [Plantibacter sp. MCCC 1A11337]|nr:hypothetical protein [Plantibacter sp. MCCC 1A11337]
MAYCRANQGAFFAAERELGVVGAPQANAAGGVERSFSALDELAVGDAVFSYMEPTAVALSRLLARAAVW